MNVWNTKNRTGVDNVTVCFDISPGESCGFDRVDGDSLARGRGPPPAQARGRGPTQARGRGPVSSQDLPGTGKGASPGAGQRATYGLQRAASRLSKFGFVKGTSNSLRIHRTGTLPLVECLIQLVFICVRKQGQRTDSSAYPPLYVLARQTGQKRVGDAGSSRATCTLPQ